eukprot:COSAG02_NODE_2156_length_9643_cov_55.052761_12_plen_75_part_00
MRTDRNRPKAAGAKSSVKFPVTDCAAATDEAEQRERGALTVPTPRRSSALLSPRNSSVKHGKHSRAFCFHPQIG